jgi:hypothetical protein
LATNSSDLQGLSTGQLVCLELRQKLIFVPLFVRKKVKNKANNCIKIAFKQCLKQNNLLLCKKRYKFTFFYKIKSNTMQRESTKKKYERIKQRFKELYEVERKRSDDVIDRLCNEFFVSSITIYRALKS